jgi:hypothetical protein
VFLEREVLVTVQPLSSVPMPDLPVDASDILMFGITISTGTRTNFVGRFYKNAGEWVAQQIYGNSGGSNYPAIAVVGGVPHFKNSHPTTAYTFAYRASIAKQSAAQGAPFELFSALYHTGNFNPADYLGVNATAAAATKLAAGRTINGVLFDGTANISLPLEIHPGAIVAFARTTAPAGWLKANGAAVSRATYAGLFAAIGTTFGVGDGSTTFNLPDLRGEFVRGWDDGRGVDIARTFGSAQTHQLQEHNHGGAGQLGNVAGGSGEYVFNGATGGASPIGENYTPTTGNVGAFGTETRPRNVALLACIKY